MRIIFDLRKVGLGNNGGSSTIVNSANVLNEIGHDVCVVSTTKNMHTWTKLKVPHLRAGHIKQIPDADFIIATGYKSVTQTMSAPRRCGVKMHWIRGWETWQMPENKIVKHILGAQTIKLVNGVGLQRKLESYDCFSHIVRPGYDVDKLYPLNIRQKNENVILGALYNSNRKNQDKRTGWIWETTFKLKSIRSNLKLWFFGDHKRPDGFLFDNYVRRPSLDEKNQFYNHINIWLAPSGLEGLHMPPAEAMLTGCPVIGTNSKMSGMHEYLIHNKTGIISKNHLVDFTKAVKKLVDDRELQIKLGKNAREEVLTIGSRHENMARFTELLKRLKNGNL